MHIGKRIAKTRKKKSIPQAKVAKDVLSLSHLSNIESCRYEPTEHALEQLANKLKVPKDYLLQHKEVDSDLESLLVEVKDCIEFDVRKAGELLDQIQRDSPYIHSIYQEVHYFGLRSYYYIRMGEMETAQRVFNAEFLPLIDVTRMVYLPQNIQEIYYYVQGIIHSHQQDYIQSYQCFLHGLPLASNDSLKSNLCIQLAYVLLKLYNLSGAIEYTNTALAIYTEKGDVSEIARAHNLLGALHWENQELSESENHLHQALEIANQYSLDYLKEKIYHNFGLLYKTKKEYLSSKEYFVKSLELKKRANSPGVNMTYRSLLDLFLTQDMIEDVMDDLHATLKDAQRYCSDTQESYHLKVIEAKMHLKMGQRKEYESNMTMAVDYFYKNQLWKHLEGFAEDLADFYQRSRKYKLAAKYFSIELETHKQLYGGKKHENV